MKSFFTRISAYISAKQLSGVAAVLGLALLIPRGESDSAIAIDSADGFVPSAAMPAATDASAPSAVQLGATLSSSPSVAVTQASAVPRTTTAPLVRHSSTRSATSTGSANGSESSKAAAVASIRSSAISGGRGPAGPTGGGVGTTGGSAGGGYSAGQSNAQDTSNSTDQADSRSNQTGNLSSESRSSPPVAANEQGVAPKAQGSNATGDTVAQAERHSLNGPAAELPAALIVDGPENLDGLLALGSADLALVDQSVTTPKTEVAAISAATTVPDTGTTSLLLAGAMVGLFAVRRRRA